MTIAKMAMKDYPCKPLIKAKKGDIIIIPKKAKLSYKGYGEVQGRVTRGEYRHGIIFKMKNAKGGYRKSASGEDIEDIMHPKEKNVCLVDANKFVGRLFEK
jgi:hypothetical protein